MHIPTRQELHDALRSPSVERLSPMARERLRWIVDFVESGQSVTETCARFGIARATFHRWLERFDVRDLTTLEDRPVDHAPRPPAVAPHVIALIRAYREEYPLMGKQQISERLQTDHSLTVSGSTVGRVIERECLFFADTPLHWRKRLHHSEHHHPRIDSIAEQASSIPSCVTAAHDCGWCRMRNEHWPVFRRHIAIASVLLNLAMIGLFTMTVLWEASRATPEEQRTLPASALPATLFSSPDR